MADKQEKEKVQEIRVAPSFDESLHDFLLKNRITIKNIDDILGLDDGIGIPHYRYGGVSNFNIPKFVESFKTQFVGMGGCIFILPSGRRDAKSWVIWSKYSSEEIRRIVNLKAFL